METINICYTTDNEYLAICGVSLHSLLKASDKNNQYNVYILYHKKSLHPFKKESFCNYFNNHKNLNLYFIEISAYWDELNKECKARQTNYISETSCYRICIDKFIFQNKIIYLDCDTIIKDDIKKLWDIDISDHILGVIKDKSNIDFSSYFEDILQVKASNYFNSGVLLINLEKYKEQKIAQKCFDEQNKFAFDLIYQDQDMLNMATKDQIKHLDSRWNMQWTNIVYPIMNFINQDEIEQENWNDIGIIHYNTDWKPWNCPEMPYANYFWENARETIFYEELILKLVFKTIDKYNLYKGE